MNCPLSALEKLVGGGRDLRNANLGSNSSCMISKPLEKKTVPKAGSSRHQWFRMIIQLWRKLKSITLIDRKRSERSLY